LYYRATHDALTSLANRAQFYDSLRQQLARAALCHGHVAVVNIDMDRLKAINDSCISHNSQMLSDRNYFLARMNKYAITFALSQL
jgi:diguanylate cyclase (GGDEF)-like protein